MSNNPFTPARLPELAVTAESTYGVKIVAMPNEGARAQGALTRAAGSYELWITDNSGAIWSMANGLTEREMMLVMQMVKLTDFTDWQEARTFLKAAAKDAKRYAFRIAAPYYLPAQYAVAQ